MIRLNAGFRGLTTVVALVAVTVVGCGGGTDPAGGVASISIGFTGSGISLGAVQSMNPTFRDGTGKAIPYTGSVTWTSSNSGVASVDHAGKVTGVAIGGPVTITARVGSATASTSISVIPDRITFAQSISTVGIGQSIQLSASPLSLSGSAIPASAAPVSWSSSNTAVATVGATTGLLTGVTAGTTHITATAAGQTAGFDVEVGTVSPYDGVWLGQSASASRPIEINVVFGQVRTFRLTYFLFTAPYASSCAARADATGSPNATITNGQFSFNLTTPAGVAVSGTFTSTTSMTGNHGQISLGTYTCNLLNTGQTVANTPMNANVPANSFTAAKQ